MISAIALTGLAFAAFIIGSIVGYAYAKLMDDPFDQGGAGPTTG